jgi:hypothetical protein
MIPNTTLYVVLVQNVVLVQVGEVSGGTQHAGRPPGAVGRVHGRQRQSRRRQGLPRVLPVSVLTQGRRQKELFQLNLVPFPLPVDCS